MQQIEPLSPVDPESELEVESESKHFSPGEVDRRVNQHLERLMKLQEAQPTIPFPYPPLHEPLSSSDGEREQIRHVADLENESA